MSKLTCSMPSCSRPRRTAKLCGMHYLRKWKHGDPNIRLSAANGEGSLHSSGYRYITVEGRQMTEHQAMAERALGRSLPRGAEVHHVNEIKDDNRPGNLVICPDTRYHKLLHVRSAAYDATGDPNKRQCRFCRQWDDPANLYMPPRNLTGLHHGCRRKARRVVSARRLDKLWIAPAATGAP